MNPVNTLPTYSLKIYFNITITELVAITGALLAEETWVFQNLNAYSTEESSSLNR
jgi:hypothetical protein